ncbi:MAG: 1-deoxy-D-xylulose-5-phosphate synthase [Bacillota bacterium]
MYLEKIESPKDLRKLSVQELEILCHEVRENIVQITKNNGGHLASNLGTVELSVAILYVFDTEEDKVIYDVGHQCYTHKILTGRRDQFSTLRQKDGISGFPKTKESPHDAFNTGHSGTSISVGYGMAIARDILNKNQKIISVIGDGSVSTGLSFEALNGLCEYKGQFLVVLNDNGMSISKNVGGLSKYLSGVRANKGARKVKSAIRNAILKLPKGDKIKLSLSKTKRKFFAKYSQGKFFELMGIDYFGAIDGHNIKELISFLETMKDIENPCILHVKTTKGKGFSDAEESPEYFHGVSKDFAKSQRDFSAIAGEKLLEMAKKNEKIVAISASMQDGVGLSKFAKEMPEKLFDVGICEPHAVTFSAGLAQGGLRPYFLVYSSFLQRGFDGIYHDVVLPNLPVTFLIDRCGIVGADGETHQGVMDLNFLISCGGIDIICPKDESELESALEYSLTSEKPLAIRYPRGYSYNFKNCESEKFEYGKWEILKAEKSKTAVIACGAVCCENAVKAYEKSEIKFSVINARWVNPIDEKMLSEIKADNIIVLSESNQNGGFTSVVSDYYMKNNQTKKIIKMEIPCILESGSACEQREKAGMSEEDIIKRIKQYEA